VIKEPTASVFILCQDGDGTWRTAALIWLHLLPTVAGCPRMQRITSLELRLTARSGRRAA
jgi:hypothetical protein